MRKCGLMVAVGAVVMLLAGFDVELLQIEICETKFAFSLFRPSPDTCHALARETQLMCCRAVHLCSRVGVSRRILPSHLSFLIIQQHYQVVVS